MATIKIELPDDQAEALANLCKRIDYNTMRELSDGEAAHKALDRGLWALRQAIAEAGIEVR
ncbi:DUF7706 family protein [Bradyrhizobium ottawaense]|uniref:DUF7706 family protein n=1 Tax=Bradyrhizobium ottawaense TaxID=931866 RepID=UPI0030F3A7E9